MIIRKCERCGKEFETHPYRIAQGKARFCSRQCRFDGHRIKVKCQECGKEFETVQSRIESGKNKFCSKECYYKSTREKRNCIVCGKEFEFLTSQRIKKFKSEMSGKFCSGSCRSKYFRGKNHQNYSDGTTLVCKQCGKNFTRKNWTINQRKKQGYNQDFCSHKCSEKYHQGKNNPSYKEKIKLNCIICNKEFSVIPANQNRFRTCSKACNKKWHSQLMAGEKHHQWKGGISFEPYCPKFNNEFKERVRIFFGRKCGECGKTEEENGRKLDVHHINYRKDSCCSDDVIPLFISLCQSHNASANKDRENWEQHYTDIINTKYGGKCYLTKEEYTNSRTQPQ